MGTGSGPIGPEGSPFLAELPQRPNVARVYDALLGGKDNLSADREVAARLTEAQPLVTAGVRANRAFLRRAIAYLASLGIDQFLDLGSGLPTRQNVHQVAGRINPGARVVYVDVDEVVLVHARALLADHDRTIVVEGDIRDPAAILADPDVRGHLDLTRPVGVVMVAVLHFVAPQEDPARIVAAFRDVMVPGSALVVTHLIEDGDPATRKSAEIYSQTTAPVYARTVQEVTAWFDGFTLVPPGLVNVDQWRRSGRRTTNAPMAGGAGLLDNGPPGGMGLRGRERPVPSGSDREG